MGHAGYNQLEPSWRQESQPWKQGVAPGFIPILRVQAKYSWPGKKDASLLVRCPLPNWMGNVATSYNLLWGTLFPVAAGAWCQDACEGL